MTVVYLDILVTVNWLIDFLLLRACARILHLPCRRGRAVLGALFGGFCACVLLLPELPSVASLLLKLVTAGIMALIAFPWTGLFAYLRQTGLLFLISALFAGLSFALWYFVAPAGFYVSNGAVYYQIHPLLLALLCCVCYCLVCLYEHWFCRENRSGGRYRLTVTDHEGSVTIDALHDSGNGLTELFSGAPVIVAEKSALLPILSPTMRQALEGLSAGAEVSSAEEILAAGWRLIPFRSVGGSGLLPAFRPRRLLLKRENGKSGDITGCYIALCPSLGRGEYRALIGTDPISLLQTAQKGERYEMVT